MTEQREGWHRHANGGGWVQDTAHVDSNACIKRYAEVSGTARVFGNAYVSGNARVSGNAEVSGTARVFGNAYVSGNADVFDNARVQSCQHILWGCSGGYHWTTYPTQDEQVWLQFGCEAHLLEWWEAQHRGRLCVHHEHELAFSPYVTLAINAARMLRDRIVKYGDAQL
jgi:hypothetical protein